MKYIVKNHSDRILLARLCTLIPVKFKNKPHITQSNRNP
jgi:hypothetical protein